jgi:hypothetical protein
MAAYPHQEKVLFRNIVHFEFLNKDAQQAGFCEISGSHGGMSEDELLSGMLCHVLSYRLTDVSEVLTASFIRAP